MDGRATILQKAPRVKLEPNIAKIVAAICFVIAEAAKSGQKPTQYEIVKTLFLADKKHLNTYGRPITFDNYCAMNHGPVPSLAYDLLKGDATTIKKHGLKKLPWTKNKGERTTFRYTVTKACSTDALSPSDEEALSGAWGVIQSLTFSQIRQLTHNDPAYAEAWSGDDNRQSHPMSLALLFETPNYEAAESISFLSKHS